MQEPSLLIQKIDHENQHDFWDMLGRFSFQSDRNYYERCIERHVHGKVMIPIAFSDDVPVGFCILNWEPKYGYFKKCSIPEIQDLNVLRQHRQRGIGQALIQHCEDVVRERGYEQVGIGVGLDSSFGAAQRLYVKMGYIPDGYGVTYDRKAVTVGEFKPIDENLSLMMAKNLT